MSPGPRPTSVPNGIVIHTTIWLQYTNVGDRQAGQWSRSIGQTVTCNGRPETVPLVLRENTRRKKTKSRWMCWPRFFLKMIVKMEVITVGVQLIMYTMYCERADCMSLRVVVAWMCFCCVQFPFSLVDPEFPVQGSACAAWYSTRECVVPPEGVHRQHSARLRRPSTDQQHAARVQAWEVGRPEWAGISPVWGWEHAPYPGYKGGAVAGGPAPSC